MQSTSHSVGHLVARVDAFIHTLVTGLLPPRCGLSRAHGASAPALAGPRVTSRRPGSRAPRDVTADLLHGDEPAGAGAGAGQGGADDAPGSSGSGGGGAADAGSAGSGGAVHSGAAASGDAGAAGAGGSGGAAGEGGAASPGGASGAGGGGGGGGEVVVESDAEFRKAVEELRKSKLEKPKRYVCTMVWF